jgi:DNA helicase IV
MSTNYRSPAEVFDLASRVVVATFPEADLPTAVRSTGIEPELRAVEAGELLSAVSQTVAELLELMEGTVGVICPPSRKLAVDRQLKCAPSGGDDRIVLVSPLEAKGLEYDAVLVIAPDEVVAESPGGIRSLYVALTRATQRLVTLDVGSAGDWRRSLE